ncbi:MAG: D-alanine--D-alanine ligase [Planctomycetota bacterium]|nr:D-alanine--D-alanine ligase [Planctomycetota bacterium]
MTSALLAQRPSLQSCHVAVLAGGRSSEREVSLKSARGIVHALRGGLTRAHALPRKVTEVELDLDGRWVLEGTPLAPAQALARLADVDVFLIGLHGGEGEDGTLQGLLASVGACHTGSGVRASALCMDKLATRGIAASVGVRVADGLCFSAAEWNADSAALLARAVALANDGWVVKPRFGGSSVATCVTRKVAELEPAIRAVLDTGDDVLVEARIAGVETSCGVLGNRGDEPLVLQPIEIRPTKGEWFDYAEKYSADGAREVCPPESIALVSVERIRASAGRVYQRAGCDGYARIDFMVPVAGGVEGEPVMLEVNTLPGMTERSLLPQEAAVAGIDYTALCLRIVELALRRAKGGA